MTALGTSGTMAPAPQDAGSDGLYLYAILEEAVRDSPAWRDAASAIGGLAAVSAAGLVAASAPVPTPFAELAAALGDDGAAVDSAATAARLEEAVRAHERAVERLLGCGPLLPVRLGTVVRSARDVARLLERDAIDLHRQLAVVGRRREWGVKVWWRASAGVGTAPRAAEGADEAAGPGRAYLAARRQQREEAATVRRRCEGLGQAVGAALEAVAPASFRAGLLAVRDHAGADEDAECLVLEGSFLVDPVEEAGFFRQVDAALAAAGGATAECSGPWPPYAFTRLSLGAS